MTESGRATGPAASVRHRLRLHPPPPALPAHVRRAGGSLRARRRASGRSRRAFSYSFYDYSLLRPDARSFVGLDNYRALFTDDAARNSIVTTVIFTVSAVTLEFVLGLGLALLLWRDSVFQPHLPRASPDPGHRHAAGRRARLPRAARARLRHDRLLRRRTGDCRRRAASSAIPARRSARSSSSTPGSGRRSWR